MSSSDESICIKGFLVERNCQSFRNTLPSQYPELFQYPPVSHFTISGWKVIHELNQSDPSKGKELILLPDEFLRLSMAYGFVKETKYGFRLFGRSSEKMGNYSIYRCILDKDNVKFEQYQIINCTKPGQYLTPIACCLYDEMTSHYIILHLNKSKNKLVMNYRKECSPTSRFERDVNIQKSLQEKIQQKINDKLLVPRDPLSERLRIRRNSVPDNNNNNNESQPNNSLTELDPKNKKKSNNMKNKTNNNNKNNKSDNNKKNNDNNFKTLKKTSANSKKDKKSSTAAAAAKASIPTPSTLTRSQKFKSTKPNLTKKPNKSNPKLSNTSDISVKNTDDSSSDSTDDSISQNSSQSSSSDEISVGSSLNSISTSKLNQLISKAIKKDKKKDKKKRQEKKKK